MEGKEDIAIKDPRTIARKYQLDLCKKAVEENTIVCLGTGCGKTHIALLLMHELAHLFRKPKRDVCVFLAPTIPLVRQQALVIENSTDFKVQTYFGGNRQLKTHDDWNEETDKYEVLVMTPQILLRNLRHCFVRMELIALLIFDECHHAQIDTRHPYAQIMKEFYGIVSGRRPRVFGMTASPVVGKGGSNQPEFAKYINSLENLLDAKICSVEDDTELESIVPSSEVHVYFYRRFGMTTANVVSRCFGELEKLKDRFFSVERDKATDLEFHKKRMKLLLRVHDHMVFCLDSLGLWGAIQAARILLASDGSDLMDRELDTRGSNGFLSEYLNSSISVLNCNLFSDSPVDNELPLDALEEPFFSKKLQVLIGILQRHMDQPDIRCIVFVRRIIVAKSLAYILKKLTCLAFWRCDFLVGFHSGCMSRNLMNTTVEKFSSGKINLLVATNVAEEGLDIQTCSVVIRFDLPETVASFIQSRGRARMSKSEYAFIVERGNTREEKLLDQFRRKESAMNKEISCRSSTELLDYVEEATYRVDSTGASISTSSSVALLHHYCSKLPRDEYFNPLPKFFYIDDPQGTICRVLLPSNCPVRQADSDPLSSRDGAKRSACLKACIELHNRGALSDYLLPGSDFKETATTGENQCQQREDPSIRQELHEMLVPTLLTKPLSSLNAPYLLHFYYVKFIPIPKDRDYRKFGLFVSSPLPKEVESLEVDLHLAHGRIVKTSLVPLGVTKFNSEEIELAKNFQEMSLRVVLDRADFVANFVSLGTYQTSSLTTSYLLLPVVWHKCGNHMIVEWDTIQICLSSPVFKQAEISDYSAMNTSETLTLAHGLVYAKDVVNSLVYVPTNCLFYFIDDILMNINCYSNMTSFKELSYIEYYKKKFSVTLLQPEQPLLKAKRLFYVRNLLCNRQQDNTEVREREESFVELPPELCQLKIIGFSKDIGSSLSLLPSFMHRLQNLLAAEELKTVLTTSFPEGSRISSFRLLEALTTEKCLERFSLERLEILGDAFLKYAVGRHTFLSNVALDEGQLTNRRSKNINNSHLYGLAISKRLHLYICDAKFDPANFFALGRPCRVTCNHHMDASVQYTQGQPSMQDGSENMQYICDKYHRCLHTKTIADVVEAIVGAFLVDSGFKAATAFLKWLGIACDYQISDLNKTWEESKKNMPLVNKIDVDSLEKKLGYCFQHKGLLIQAFIHPSYSNHSGGCYQRLEFLGDAVMDYLITSYVFSTYPELKPGQLSDLRSIIVNNSSFAHVSVDRSLHEFLLRDSEVLTQAISKFQSYICMNNGEKDDMEEPAIPKVLGDIVESCIGAILIDSGFNMNTVWGIMLILFEPVLRFSGFLGSPIRELMELCQFWDLKLHFPEPVKNKGIYMVKVDAHVGDRKLSCFSKNCSSKTAKKLAAKEMISKLKALGYKHKSKSLEEVLLTTRKENTELIGFDEEPILLKDVISTTQLEDVQIREQMPQLIGSDGESILVKDVVDTIQFKKLHINEKAVPNATYVDFSHKDLDVTCISSPSIPALDPKFATSNTLSTTKCEQPHVSSKSRLFEICTSNYWNPPSFVCCKEEGPSHLKMFTYKVTVQIKGSPHTILECFSEPRQKKKAAEEHAAEAAIWYLTCHGYK